MSGYCYLSTVPWAWLALPVGMHGILLSDEIPCSSWSAPWLCFLGSIAWFCGGLLYGFITEAHINHLYEYTVLRINEYRDTCCCGS